MKKLMKHLVLVLSFSSIILSCRKKDDPIPSNPQNPNEEELITTLKLILTEDGTGTVYTFVFKDLDGDGGNSPVKDNIVLPANKTYAGQVVLLDETKNPVDSISNEVLEEGDEHQFFYTITSVNL